MVLSRCSLPEVAGPSNPILKTGTSPATTHEAKVAHNNPHLRRVKSPFSIRLVVHNFLRSIAIPKKHQIKTNDSKFTHRFGGRGYFITIQDETLTGFPANEALLDSIKAEPLLADGVYN